MKYLYLILTLMLLISCQDNNSSTPQDNSQISPSSLNSETTNIYKPDGATQCKSTGTSLNVMSQVLINAGIDVLCYQKSNDVNFRGSSCGLATGSINVFKINKNNLNSVLTLGFLPIQLIPGVVIKHCKENTTPKIPDYVKVYKSYNFNGICGNRKYPVDLMAKELISAGVNVACSKNESHIFFNPTNTGGGIQTAVCKGKAHGFNVFKINSTDSVKAKAVGFNPVSDLPIYVDSKCIPDTVEIPKPPILIY